VPPCELRGGRTNSTCAHAGVSVKPSSRHGGQEQCLQERKSLPAHPAGMLSAATSPS
jgi:hypothetical protein